MNPAAVERFAREWIAAWNSRDLERILSHYADAIHLTSPIAARLTGNAQIRGKAALRCYFAKGLTAYPALRFLAIAWCWATGTRRGYRPLNSWNWTGNIGS